MVTRSPLLNGVEGTHRNAPMEAPRGEGVVELVLGSRGGLSGCVIRRHVQGVWRQALRRRARQSARLPAGY